MGNDVKTYKSALNQAIKYLSYQPRSVYEMQKYMQTKKINKKNIEKIIQILLEDNYLNDLDFAKLFVQSRVNTRPKSKFAFHYELRKKGINTDIIEKILLPYDDRKLAIKSVEPKLRLWQSFDNEKFKKKIMNHLRYRGFNYDICLSTLHYFIELKEHI